VNFGEELHSWPALSGATLDIRFQECGLVDRALLVATAVFHADRFDPATQEISPRLA
jgi:hypothetical protein